VIIRPHSVQRYKPLLCVSSFLAISAISLRLVRFCPFHILKGAPEGAGKYGKRTEELRIECSLDHRRVSAFGPRCLKASSGGPRFACTGVGWFRQIPLVLSRQQANLLDRHHLCRRVQGIARVPVVQFVLVLTIFLSLFGFRPVTQI
jgi:hypothetical protein